MSFLFGTKKTLFALCFFAASTVVAVGQQKYELSLDESIEIAKERSHSMERLRYDLEIANFNLKAATARLRTRVDMNITAPNYTRDIAQRVDESGTHNYTMERLANQAGITIRQPLPTDGEISISNVLYNTRSYYSSQMDSQFDTRITFRQPLHVLWGYNNIRNDLKNAKLNYERSQRSLKREELNLIYDVSNAFYNLLSLQKSAEISLANVGRQQENYDLSVKKLDDGLIREVEALQMEVDLIQARNDYDLALLNQTSATTSFKELLGLELNDEVTLENELSEYIYVEIDSDEAVRMAFKNRHEIRENEIAIEMQQLEIKRQKSNRRPQADITAYYSRRGVYMDRLSFGFTNSIEHALSDYGQRPSNYGVSLNISIPIFDWGQRKSNLRAAELRQKQNYIDKERTERTIETEVRSLVDKVNSNYKGLLLLEKSIEVAEKSFAITQKRFDDRDIDAQALALDRDRLNGVYNNRLRAYINYKLSLADLMRKTFYDFENKRPIE